MKKITSPNLQKVKDIVIRRSLETAVEHGHLDVKGKSEDQIRLEFAQYILERIDKSEFLIAIDHTEKLLKLGKKFEEAGDPWTATLMYATWVEHVINKCISAGLQRKNFSPKMAKQVIRDVPLTSKLSWVFPLLDFRPFNTKHGEVLRKLGEYRNQFVHYKWNYKEWNGNEDIATFLIACKKSLIYLTRYRNTQLMSVSSMKLNRAAKLHP